MTDEPALDDPAHPDNYTDDAYARTYTEAGTEGPCTPIPDEVLADALDEAERRFPDG